MTESETISTADIEALEALQADASELERVEGLLDRFNVFETIGFTNQELMHSRFLAFLLDTKRTHSLGDLVLRGFLRKCSESTDRYSLPQANDGNLSQTTVYTEVYTGDGRIDILLQNEAGEWAIIVENKIWTTEHSGPLEKYYRFVKENHRDHLVQGIYLTPYGHKPTHKKYLALSYRAVGEIMEGVLEDRGSSLSPDVRMSMEHYVQMLRRNIVGDPKIAKLCQQIYQKHKRAFDLIIEHQPWNSIA